MILNKSNKEDKTMLKKANINWTAKQLSKMVDNGTARFDSSVQRGYVWDNDRKSLLIHSMIEGYPIPAFFAAKERINDKESIYQFLDGKQRSNAINQFLNDSFKLSNIPDVTTEIGEEIDINNLTFSELPEEIQDRIKDYSLTIYYFDEITDEEINSMFFRLNNGKALTSIELTRVKAKSIEAIKRIGQHDLFKSALTEKAMNKYTNEDITIKAWAVLYTENPSFETKIIRPLMEQAEITEEQEQEINQIFTRIKDTYEIILNNHELEEKQRNKIAKRIITRTHLLSIVPIALQSIKDNIAVEQFADWACHFFNGKKSATISEKYNDNASQGSARDYAVKARLEEVAKSYRQYFNK